MICTFKLLYLNWTRREMAKHEDKYNLGFVCLAELTGLH